MCWFRNLLEVCGEEVGKENIRGGERRREETLSNARMNAQWAMAL